MKVRYEERRELFIQHVRRELNSNVKHNKKSIERIAGSYGITDKTEIKEYTELAIVLEARMIAGFKWNIEERYHKIVALYQNQVNLSHRTSQSILLQQYSTPAPIAFLAGIFVRADLGTSVFEPSAGNGLLTIAALPQNVIVNEIDDLRRSNLEAQGYSQVLKQDATKAFKGFEKAFDAVLTNPPFGTLDREVKYESFGINTLDHLMALRALDTMKDNGKAAIIIGGHTRYDKKGRIQAGKNRIFFNYLFSRYNVVDLINVSGHKLYSRQGTSFDVRLILINGRKLLPFGSAPIAENDRDSVVTTFSQLYDRVMDAFNNSNNLFDLPFQVYKYYKPIYHDSILLIQSNDSYISFNEDAEILAMINNTPLLKVKRHEGKEFMAAIMNKAKLNEFVAIMAKGSMKVFILNSSSQHLALSPSELELEVEALALELDLRKSPEELGMPYTPASESCVVLDTVVPDSMGFETHAALARVREAVGGDIDEYVRTKLNYKTKTELCKALAAEQIDAVGMAIYNIEERNQGMIIGDQTGIGKGRIAASIIRYGVNQGVQPIFITEKANLFSDIYRDLVAIGCKNLVPFIINARESKTDIKDEDGEVVYTALPANEQSRIFQDQKVPARFDFIVGTYSQFNSPDKKPEKPAFLNAIAEDAIFIMDEAHNSSGSSNVGNFLQSVISKTRGVIFLSATFAKRPDNMPIYAMKTSISEASMSRDELVEAITTGGVALQEILAGQLVAEGQMIRRERSFEGVEVNYITLEEKEQEHKAIADNITGILREIIDFQAKFVDDFVDELDDIAVAEGKQVELREGTSQAGVDNQPYFSKIFNVINQMLFSIKAESVAERAIMRLKEGKKPVIAFSSTMGSFIEQIESSTGQVVSDGDFINADFSEVLQRGLEGVLRYTETGVNGEKIYKKFDIHEFSPEGQADYLRISKRIQAISTGITISPIDIIVQKLKDAGYSVAEVTGRKYELQINVKNNQALIMPRKKVNTNDAFRQFNNNEVDVLLINQSGSTGASAHAIVTPKVPKDKVKQRVMIVLQAELDINTEVQKRGRINRTGQIIKPIYDYVNSAIPAEKRLMMMLQKKLKSLDANTTSNQKSSTKILDVPDFLNKYGDHVVAEYLKENLEVNTLLDDPLGLENTKVEISSMEGAAHKVSGRVAVLSTAMQLDFYNEISSRYNEYVEYLKQIGDYDLEVEAMDLQAETVSSRIVKMGKGGESEFGDDSMLEVVMANVLKKPFSTSELNNLISESLQGKEAFEQQKEIIRNYEHDMSERLKEELDENKKHYEALMSGISNEKKLKQILKKDGESAFQEAVKNREVEIRKAEQLSEEKIRKGFNNRQAYLSGIFDFYYVGQNLNYPINSYDSGQELVFAVFLGFIIDIKKKNPYAPSSIRLRFAIANSNKYIALPASYSKDITAIKGASISLNKDSSVHDTLTKWEAAIQESNVDRKIRHIITGNLLQAFSSYKGKLVSYSTKNGEVKKGILMPESWNPGNEGQQKVEVPISKALKIIRSITNGQQITTNNDISIFKQPGKFKIIVSSSRQKSGDVFLDPEILQLVDRNNFEKISDKMMATIEEDKIDKFIILLQDKFSASVSLSRSQFDLIKDSIQIKPVREKPVIKNESRSPKHVTLTDVKELELEALALELELELLEL